MKRYLAAAGYATLPGPITKGAALLVDGDRIIAFGTRAAVPAPEGVEDVDLGDAVLLPGFIDAHVHLVFDGGADPIASVRAADDAQLREIAARNAALLLAAGVTTARDLGSRGLDTAAVASPAPTMLRAGSPVTSIGGHCWFLGGEAADADDAVRLIRRQTSEGADWAKLMLSGGFLTPTTAPARPQFPLALVRRAVDAAHEAGALVAAHAHSAEAIRFAALAGVDTIEHATFVGEDGIDFDPALAELLAERAVAICPTANGETASYPEATGRDALRRLKGLADAGVRVVMGTDAGVRLVTGDRYAEGLVALAEAGFTPTEVLAAATTRAAAALGIEQITGRLAAGLRADAVATASDPHASLAAAEAPVLVLADGREAVSFPAGTGRR